MGLHLAVVIHQVNGHIGKGPLEMAVILRLHLLRHGQQQEHLGHEPASVFIPSPLSDGDAQQAGRVFPQDLALGLLGQFP